MEDAARLRKLFETVKNRAKFAREYDVPERLLLTLHTFLANPLKKIDKFIWRVVEVIIFKFFRFHIISMKN